MLTAEQRESLDGKGIDWKRVQYVSAGDALTALTDPATLVVDIRDVDRYGEGHFPGAVHARGPEMQLKLPRDRAIYLYCT